MDNLQEMSANEEKIKTIWNNKNKLKVKNILMMKNQKKRKRRKIKMIIEEDNRREKKEQEKQYLVDIIKSLNLPKHYYTEFDVYSNLHINKGTNKWYKTI